ncbi:zinc finger, C3HC4 type (RING finger) protein (macronuclear) [Tetrahymena thermophila SB210]|uniref:Zinc finger, C3HC4 type (RING finger) protein n=1 Tax=Tetrahymena thermophila (strain SB210) TaxID=312017 RepID=Q23UD7_TETTS|nr:zinc finger, C3HC4 type (RING finger) protein [Tetrahymena thermophila SB210]EAS00128.2 zinc finger, C3HC4 type (RING finger) protein [Tetrahymena thermophila SB210]|eukprot:XP_001020373.2 zinc finger, C3HC4 type (RING finger) protein [Tetrahymena thermophila SB210]
MQVNINNIQGLNENQAIISGHALSPQNQVNTNLGLVLDFRQQDQKLDKKRVTITNDFSMNNYSDQKKDDSKMNTDRHMNDRLSISNQQHQRTDSIQNQGDQYNMNYPSRVTEVAQNTEFNPTLSDNNQNEQLEQRLGQQQQNNNQNSNQENMNDEDKVKSLMIIKSVIIKSMNVYVFLIFYSAQMIMDFNYKVVVSILLLFDLFSIYTNFQKYRLNKKVDIDEYQTEEEIEFRYEYNKYLLLKVIEIIVFFIFKILLIIRFDVIYINLVLVTTIVFVFVVFKILYMFKLKVKEYNPIFNETMLLLFKLFVSFQALLVSLKVEQTVDWDWVHIFWPAYIFLLTTAVITLGLIFIIITKCYFCLKRSSQKKIEIIGLLWICIFMVSFTVTSIMFLKSFIFTEDYGQDDSMQVVLFISLVFLVVMLMFSSLEWNQIIQFVYEISIIINAEEEEDIEYVISENPEQQKKAKNKSKRIKTVNPTEQDEQQNNIPQFLQKLSSTYFSAIANRQNVQNNLAKNSSKIKQQIKDQKEKGTRHKSQSFMIHKYEINHSVDFNKKPIQDINVSISQRNQGNSDQNKWKKIALDTNQKFKKLIDTPQIQKLSQQLNTHVKKKLFENYSESPKNTRVCKSNNVSFVGHQDSHRGNKKIEQSVIEDKDIQVNAPNMNDQSNVTCVICFDNAPDSVYMPCGHGGVCYECSVDIMKNTGECYLCREAIKEILRLDIKEKAQNNNFRVVALTTLVDESIVEDKKQNKNQLNNIHEVEEDNHD